MLENIEQHLVFCCGQKKKFVGDVGKQLGVTIKQVFMWCRKFKEEGSEWIKVKKQTGRITDSENKAKEVIPELLKTRSASIRLFERSQRTRRYISATGKRSGLI